MSVMKPIMILSPESFCACAPDNAERQAASRKRSGDLVQLH